MPADSIPKISKNAFTWLLCMFLCSCSSQKISKLQSGDFLVLQHNEKKANEIKPVEPIQEVHIGQDEKMPQEEKPHEKHQQKLVKAKKQFAEIKHNTKEFIADAPNKILPKIKKATVEKKPKITWKDVAFFFVWLIILTVLIIMAQYFAVGPFIYLIGAAVLTVLVIGAYVYWNSHMPYPKYNG